MPLINYDFSKGDFDNSKEAAQARVERAKLLRVAGRVLTMLGENREIASKVLKIVVEEMGIPKGDIFPPDLGGGQEYHNGGPNIP